jgi:hypothetical protein
MALAANDHARDEVRAIARFELHGLNTRLKVPVAGRHLISDQAHISFASWQIERFEKDPRRIELTPPAEPPDGPPIGTDDDGDFWD